MLNIKTCILNQKSNGYNIYSMHDLSQHCDVLNNNSRVINFYLPSSKCSTEDFGWDEYNYNIDSTEKISADEAILDYFDDLVDGDNLLSTR